MSESPAKKLVELVPDQILERIKATPVTEVGWGAGPSFIVRKTKAFNQSTNLYTALEWLETDRHVFRACHVRFADGRVLWLNRHSFWRLDETDHELRSATPGMIVQTSEGSMVIKAAFRSGTEDHNGET